MSASDPRFPAWWVTFKGRSGVCVEALTPSSAAEIATKQISAPLGTVYRLPYPAEPRLTKHVQPDGLVTPSFCYTPRNCIFSSSCPNRPACTE